ncbi:MAG: DUF1653 domain-containing protein [Aquabacterium sp.]|jgi:hypothetical protein
MSTDLPALPTIPLGRYRHYKGLDYEALGVVRHSETLEPLVLYRPLYGDDAHQQGLWVRPWAMFTGTVSLQGQEVPRFRWLG